MNDNQVEVKELPEDKNTEQVSPETEDNGIKNKIIKKTEERRIIRPKKTLNNKGSNRDDSKWSD